MGKNAEQKLRKEIIATCRNGVLIDPLSPAELERALLDMLGPDSRWPEFSQNGIAAVREQVAQLTRAFPVYR